MLTAALSYWATVADSSIRCYVSRGTLGRLRIYPTKNAASQACLSRQVLGRGRSRTAFYQRMLDPGCYRCSSRPSPNHSRPE